MAAEPPRGPAVRSVPRHPLPKTDEKLPYFTNPVQIWQKETLYKSPTAKG